ncbi:nucleotidyltransferase substrate binding protein [Candidatus Babeliales bacterium]|nr:nucleotidyltransferase substrate binding protein [Candidatus Babeliales bacterium]MCF7899716.1 nucleotidyltransferase substrate binding protein [Candidatus Babeliales bacterium]
MSKDFLIFDKILITPLLKAQEKFNQALDQAKTELERDGAIQRFEFTYELIWKVLKKILDYKGLNVNSPRDVFRLAAKEGFIEDPKIWFGFLEKRNLTVHTYNQEYADEIFESLPKFKEELSKVVNKIKKL